MTDASDKYGWRPGFTRGLSEGAWQNVTPQKMRYEKSNPQHYDSPATQAYADGWERIFACKEVPGQEATPDTVDASPALGNSEVAEQETHGATRATGCEGEASKPGGISNPNWFPGIWTGTWKPE